MVLLTTTVEGRVALHTAGGGGGVVQLSLSVQLLVVALHVATTMPR